MDWIKVYRITFLVSIFIILVSLFLNKDKLYILLSGIILIITSLYEQWDIKRVKYPSKKETEPKPAPIPQQSSIYKEPVYYKPVAPSQVNYEKKPLYFSKKEKKLQDIKQTLIPAKEVIKEEKKTRFNLLNLFKRKKIEKPEEKPLPKVEQPFKRTKEIKKFEETPKAPQEIAVFKTEEDKKTVLSDYIKKALKSKFPKSKIKEAALASGWPDNLFETIYNEIAKSHHKLKNVIASVLVVLVITLIFILSKLEIFLLTYWIKTLKYASPLFYVVFLAILLLIIIFFTVKIKKTLKKKKVEYKIEEEKNVQGIKEAMIKFSVGSYETDLDKLYKILAEKQKLSISEVAKAFNISKSEAEEWGKIMRDHDLITMHYPTVGEPELIWKKLKSTQ